MNENKNRAFLYGESVFTTMRLIDDHIRDWEPHFERLKKGVEFLYGPFKESDWVLQLKNRLETRCQSETGDKILRLAVYTEQERGLQRQSILSVSELKIHLGVSPFDESRFDPKKSLSLRTCPAIARPHWWPSFLKAGNYLETILCQKKYLQSHDDDLLFLSQNDCILESSVANLFVVKGDRLFTPPLGPNVLDGVIRRKVLSAAPEVFTTADEESSSMEQLFKADGVFGSNSVRGLFLIGKVDDHEISQTEDFKVKYKALQKLIGYEKNGSGLPTL